MKKLAIITGATSGIGYELSKLIAKEDIDLLLISRSEKNLLNVRNELMKVNKNKIDIFVCDLSYNNFNDELLKIINNRDIKYLINNAGFGDFGNFKDSDYEKQINMINLNIASLINLSHIFLNLTKNYTEKAYLLNVASVAGFMPGPLMSVYYATKAFVLSFTKSIIFEERKNKNIIISCLCPGPTTTNFIKSSNLENSGLFNKLKTMTPETVAKIGYRDLKNEKNIIIPGFLNKIMIIFSKFLPNKIIIYFTYLIMKRK